MCWTLGAKQVHTRNSKNHRPHCTIPPSVTAVIIGSLVLLSPGRPRLACGFVVSILNTPQQRLQHHGRQQGYFQYRLATFSDGGFSTSLHGNRMMSSHSSSYVTTCDPIPAQYLPSWMKPERTRVLTSQKDLRLIHPASATGPSETKSIVYWMQRDVRTVDNWALLLASYLAQTHQLPLHVVHVLNPPANNNNNNNNNNHGRGSDENKDDVHNDALAPPTLENMRMTERHGKFLLGGLQLVHEELQEKHVPLHVLRPLSHRLVAALFETQVVQELSPAVIICDFHPIRHVRQWMEVKVRQILEPEGADLEKGTTIPMWQVDTHNVVPVWFAADKRQVGARTLRPKLHKVVNDFLSDKFPPFEGNVPLLQTLKTTTMTTMTTTIPPNENNHDDNDENNNQGGGTQKKKKKNNAKKKDSQTQPQLRQRLPELKPFDYEAHKTFLDWDTSVPEIPTIRPGTQAAQQQMEFFLKTGLARFDTLRNDPNYSQICSNLSPWLNHGHISFHRCIRVVKKNNKYASGSASYIEEGLVRKELSDNFLYYTPDDYDKLTGAADWARETLELHASDPRQYVYSLAELEQSQTHDDLWNAAQLQLVREGGMHGFLRMYWAKKILEWTESPTVALRTAQYFNDWYALDGRDPNGFVGVGWSIMGIHDMGWKERPIFGKIRYMNYDGCKRKFKVSEFVAKYPGAAENAAKVSEPKKLGGKKRKAPSSK